MLLQEWVTPGNSCYSLFEIGQNQFLPQLFLACDTDWPRCCTMQTLQARCRGHQGPVVQDAKCAAAAVIVKMAYLGKGVLLHPGSLARCRGHQGPVVQDAKCAAAAVIVKMAYLGKGVLLHPGSLARCRGHQGPVVQQSLWRWHT